MRENDNHLKGFTKITADRSMSRIMNQKALVSNIFDCNGISKSELAKRLELSKPAVSKNVADLMKMGLVKESGEGIAGKNGGRKPVMLYINEAYRYLGALDLSFQNPVCAVGDLRCKILKVKEIQIDRNSSAEEKISCVQQTFAEILHELDVPDDRMGVIVISQPGIIDEGGETRYSLARHHVWTEIGLKQRLMERFKVPVIVKNDKNLAAIGEIHFGNCGQVDDLIYVSCGIGLGSGVIIGGKLYEGRSGAAGELGQFLSEDGRCLGDLVTIDGMLKRVSERFAEEGKNETLTFSRIVGLVKQRDAVACQVVYEIGRELGRIIYNCSVMLNIKTVVFGGEYLKFGKVNFEGIESAITQEFPFPPEVLPSSLEDMSGVYGGFVVGKDEIFNRKIHDEYGS